MSSRYLSFKEIEILHSEMQKNKYLCSCGRKVFIAHDKEKSLCSWCGNYVYKNKKIEFVERLEHARKNY